MLICCHSSGKNDDHSIFLEKARAHAKGGDTPVSAAYSAPKAGFIVSLVEDFKTGKLSGPKIAAASDREAAKMLMGVKGIGDWCAGAVLMNFLSRADIMMYGKWDVFIPRVTACTNSLHLIRILFYLRS